jgi:LuxR family maltose regulon positive regulatory protein
MFNIRIYSFKAEVKMMGDTAIKDYRADDAGHFIRQRVNTLLSSVARSPVIIVCAGAGCGKTRAVSDFLNRRGHPFFWMTISESDNDASRFWEHYTGLVTQHHERSAEQLIALGFPDTQEKMDRFIKIRQDALTNKPEIFIFDDFHVLKEPSILRFMEKTTIHENPPGMTVILICRDVSNINIEALQTKGFVSEINENSLSFNESELTEYLIKQNIAMDSQTLHEIFLDTRGWAFAVNLVSRSLKRVPNYFGYVKTSLIN